MNFRPHDYQNYAIEYIKEHPVAGVFLSMGLRYPGDRQVMLSGLMPRTRNRQEKEVNNVLS